MRGWGAVPGRGGGRGGAGGIRSRSAQGVACEARGQSLVAAQRQPPVRALGAFGVSFLGPAPPPPLERALGLEPDRQGVNPDGLLHWPLTLHGSLMLEGAPVSPSVKWVNKSYGRNERCMGLPSPPCPADNRCSIFFHLLGEKSLSHACLPSANIDGTTTVCQALC